MKFYIFIFSIFISIIFFSNDGFAQNFGKQNLSNVLIDDLSDSQIQGLLVFLGGNNLSEKELEKKALSYGMKPSEIKKFNLRLKKIKVSDENEGFEDFKRQNKNIAQDTTQLGSNSKNSLDEGLSEFRTKTFGADLFSLGSTTFEPNIRIATPIGYQVGPDDVLTLDIYGFSEATYNLKVNPDGNINIPLVGVVYVSGISIEEATNRIRSKLTVVYPEIRSGNTNLVVSLGTSRSIQVILTGEILKPGSYTIPSVASVFNALYQSGGPSENGTFRDIQLIRNGVKILTVDLYDFLLKGEFDNKIKLYDSDVIRIPTYRNRVELVGEVKHPGFFELLDGESLNDLFKFSGGFSDRAFTSRIRVVRNTSSEKKIINVDFEQFDKFIPISGDKIFVDEILDRFQNRVTINGSVFRPGEYELDSGMTLVSLIEKAEGLTDDAFRNRINIQRKSKNLELNLISVDLNSVLNGVSQDVLLSKEDVITITSILDLKEEFYITIDGMIRNPGRYPFGEGMNLKDAILSGGGFKEAASASRIEVSRRIKDVGLNPPGKLISELFVLDINKELDNSTSDFVLQPFDVIVVRPNPTYFVQRHVKIEGEVLYPGIYALKSKDDRISDLVQRAGGLTSLAYEEGASLNRTNLSFFNFEATDKRKNLTDSLGANLTLDSVPDFNRFIGINLPKILQNPNERNDLILEDGDILFIPKELQTVKISGEVLNSVSVLYSKNAKFKNYIRNAGGFTTKANKRKAFVKYPNGVTNNVNNYLFLRFYPKILPGSEIIVPIGEEKTPVSLTEIIGVTSNILTLYLLINSLNSLR
jgi:protein involved in polysaccharide export with SLBB domain